MNHLATGAARAIALLTLAVATAACADGGAADMFAAPDPASAADVDDTTALSDVTADGVATVGQVDVAPDDIGAFRLNDSDLDDAEVGQAVTAYQMFLTATDAYRVNTESDLDALAALAGPGVVDVVAAERDAELAAADQVDVHLVDRRSRANVMNVVGDAEALLLHDCVEVEADTDFWGPVTTSTNLVDQIVTMGQAGTGWVVTDIDVRHTGEVGTTGLGCVPDRHVPRLTALVDGFFEGMVQLGQDPTGGVPAAVLDLLPEDQRATAEADALVQREDGIVFTDPVVYDYEVLGSAPSYGNRSFVVAVCATYPDGWYAREVGTGEVVHEGFAPGGQYYHELVITSVPDEAGGHVDTIVDAVNAGPVC